MHRKTIEPAGIVVPCSSIGATAVRGMSRDAWFQAHGLCGRARQPNLVGVHCH